MSDTPKKDLTGLHELPIEPIPQELVPAEGTGHAQSSEHLFETSPDSEKVDSFEMMEMLQEPVSEPSVESSVNEAVPETAQATLVQAHPSPMDSIRELSERVSVTPTSEPDYPFTLRIMGHISADEREKLCDLLSREKTGIREVDLEPQFESGRLLIPRISEFMGVILVQALRSAKVRMELTPSDASENSADIPFQSEIEIQSNPMDAGAVHPAEKLPVTIGSPSQDSRNHEVIDTVTATATLDASHVESKQSREYQEILDSLQKEIRYKAYRKGADAIFDFTIQLQPLAFPTRYRLTVMGTAIKFNL